MRVIASGGERGSNASPPDDFRAGGQRHRLARDGMVLEEDRDGAVRQRSGGPQPGQACRARAIRPAEA